MRLNVNPGGACHLCGKMWIILAQFLFGDALPQQSGDLLDGYACSFERRNAALDVWVFNNYFVRLYPTSPSRSDMETLGFYVCDADLEDELIRCLGVNAMLELIAGQGDLGRFRLFQRQPEWHEQSSEAQLRRWLGTTAHRKISYAKLLVDALDLTRVPEPLERLLARLASSE